MRNTENDYTFLNGVRLSTWADELATELSKGHGGITEFVNYDRILLSQSLCDMPSGTLRHLALSGWTGWGYHDAKPVYFFIHEALRGWEAAHEAGAEHMTGGYTDAALALPVNTGPDGLDGLLSLREGDDLERDLLSLRYYTEVLWPGLVRALPQHQLT